MLPVHISGTQTTTKATIQLRDTNDRNRLEKTTKIFFNVILRAILHKEDIKKE